MTAGPSPLWYATRATGVVALVLLTATIVLGVVGTARFETPRWPRVLTAGLHRSLSLLTVAFVAAHVLTTVLDSYAPIGWISAIIPFSSPYRTFWLSLGTIACDLLLAVVITSLLRVRLGYPAWRAVHWLSYASWPVALWHGLGTGTDSRLPWLLVLDAACMIAVVGAVFWRLSLTGNRLTVAARLLLCAAVPVATAVFGLAGPLRPGWARRAGTPPPILAGNVGPARSSSAPAAPGHSATPAMLADGSFTGHVMRTAGPHAGEITIQATCVTATHPAESLVVTLQGAPDGAGVDLSDGTVSVGSAGAAPSYSGPVVGLDGHELVAALRGPGGVRARATITLDVAGSAASGQLIVAKGDGE
jgi:Ferric reductase like transmembrane component